MLNHAGLAWSPPNSYSRVNASCSSIAADAELMRSINGTAGESEGSESRERSAKPLITVIWFKISWRVIFESSFSFSFAILALSLAARSALICSSSASRVWSIPAERLEISSSPERRVRAEKSCVSAISFIFASRRESLERKLRSII
ncbi:MAG: hypothetical protein A4E40_01030 [Methanoregulaceae archaeon PtaU1.Bin059]|nr:MAG: hypothetical protein A4E40_01030 [Methanoregulaceae archaeon PtaU1.Bin059]